ncbi:MAG: hypothetical protein HY820_05500 [Acidobacteria bacterium]|nr:hypothetical protein [Acidobacteriota bacterium]
MHHVILPVLERVLEEGKATAIVDLCSGAGGAVLGVQRALAARKKLVSVLLTDKYPNVPAFRAAQRDSGGWVRGYDGSVDATRLPEELAGVRTMFNSFHHFPPAVARGILADAFRTRQPIAIFETTERSILNTATNLPLSFLTMLALMPGMHDKRPEWWVFTYLVPLLPLAFGWDGLVSCLRSYTQEEFDELRKGLEDTTYRWRSGRLPVPRSPIHVNYFIGMPGSGAA